MLTELLCCGECGSPYRRVIWTQKGEKRVVWRCGNRLDHGKRICKHSPTLDESRIHTAVAAGMTELVNTRTAKDALEKCIAAALAGDSGEMSIPALDVKIRQLQDRQLELLQLITGVKGDCPDYDEEIQRVSMAKTQLIAKRAALEKELRISAVLDKRIEHIGQELSQLQTVTIDFDELTVR